MDGHPAAPALDLLAISAAPRWSPGAAELDDVELALAGVEIRVAVRVPPEVAAELVLATGLVLTDPEGTPIALLRPEPARGAGPDEGAAPVTGAVTPLQPAEHGPFRSLRRPAAEVRDRSSSALAVLVDQPLQDAHVTALAAAAASRPVLLLVLVGAGSPQLVDAATLVRTTLLAAEAYDHAEVVVVPLARTAPGADTERRARVLAAYGGAASFTLTSVAGAEPVEVVRATLDAGRDLPPGTFSDQVESMLRGAYRRPDQRGLTVLFTGLSGSGKSTLARALAETVTERVGRTVTLLDGDVVRRMLSAGLTFARADRELNVRRIGFVAAEISRHGGFVVCCPIAPYAATRAEVRAMVEAVGHFVLVHVSTPLAECESRDRKGLYAKARAGLIPEFTGISDPYEAPTDADLRIDTTDVAVAEGVDQVLRLLVDRGFLGPEASAGDPTSNETER